MAAVMNLAAEIEPEDRELIEQLAKLQKIHIQIRDLRRLLPSGLQEPARKVLASPRTIDPQSFSTQMSKTVQQGREDFQTLKKAWHDEKMKQLLSEANTADLDQGIDTWTVNYQSLLSASKKPSLEQEDFSISVTLESIDDARNTVEKFSKSDSRLKVQPSADTFFPFSVEVARLEMKILREEASYQVVTESSDRLAKQVAEAVNEISKTMGQVETLLLLLQAYHDIRTHKCEVCASLVDENLIMPIIRRKEAMSTNENGDSKWLAYHKLCAP